MTPPDNARAGQNGKRSQGGKMRPGGKARQDDEARQGGPDGNVAGEADPWRMRKCPECGKPARQAYRPFCSRRCADLDLARWLGGDYAIAATETDDDASEPPSPPRREE